jgi:hypothetical protein
MADKCLLYWNKSRFSTGKLANFLKTGQIATPFVAIWVKGYVTMPGRCLGQAGIQELEAEHG